MMKCRYKKDFSGLIGGFGAKAGLAHHYYPHDLKTLKITTMGMIPSLIPSRAPVYYNPPGSNQVSRSIFIKYALFETILVKSQWVSAPCHKDRSFIFTYNSTCHDYSLTLKPSYT